MHSTLQRTSHFIRCGKGNVKTLNESLKVSVVAVVILILNVFSFLSALLWSSNSREIHGSEWSGVHTIPYDLFLFINYLLCCNNNNKTGKRAIYNKNDIIFFFRKKDDIFVKSLFIEMRFILLCLRLGHESIEV